MGALWPFAGLSLPIATLCGAQTAVTKCHSRLDLKNKLISSESGGSEPAFEVWVELASWEGGNDLLGLSSQDSCAPRFLLFSKNADHIGTGTTPTTLFN